MDENQNVNEVDEAVDTADMSNEELKQAIGDYLSRERSQSMILGYRVACQTILQMIAKWRKPNCSHREYERIFKSLEEFCGKALQQEDTDNAEETVQN